MILQIKCNYSNRNNINNALAHKKAKTKLIVAYCGSRHHGNTVNLCVAYKVAYNLQMWQHWYTGNTQHVWFVMIVSKKQLAGKANAKSYISFLTERIKSAVYSTFMF